MFNFSIILTSGFNLLLAKMTFLIIDLLFVVFLAVIFKQVLSMNMVIEDVNDALIIKLSVFSLLAVAVSLFLISFVIL